MKISSYLHTRAYCRIIPEPLGYLLIEESNNGQTKKPMKNTKNQMFQFWRPLEY